jgi:hypothetical protein
MISSAINIRFSNVALRQAVTVLKVCSNVLNRTFFKNKQHDSRCLRQILAQTGV